MSAADRIRVLHEVGVMDRAGTETWLLHVLRSIDRERFRFDFLVESGRAGAYDAEVVALGSRLVPCARPSRPFAYAAAVDHVLRRAGPYDVVEGHLYLFSALALWRAAAHGVPIRIAHMYPVTDTRRRTPLRIAYRAIAARILARYATLLAVPSRSSLDATRTIRPLRSLPARIVPLGLPLGPFGSGTDRRAVREQLGLPPGAPVVTYVARFVPHKDHALVFRVADRLRAANVPAHFALAGTHGDELPVILRKAEERSDISVLVGLRSVNELLLASDVFIFPSHEEGFGMVALEAAAARLPVIASDLPVLRELLPSSHARFMFRPGDDAAAADHLSEVLRDDALREGLAADARMWAEAHSIERSVDAVTSMYTGELSSHRAA